MAEICSFLCGLEWGPGESIYRLKNLLHKITISIGISPTISFWNLKNIDVFIWEFFPDRKFAISLEKL